MKFHGCARLYAGLLSRFYYPFRFKTFGPRSILEKPLLLAGPEYISVGEGTSIRRGIRLEIIREHGTSPEIRIGSGCLIEQNVQIIARRRVVIGSNVSIAGHCAIVDVTHPYDSGEAPNIGCRIKKGFEEVVIGDGCFIGFGAVILPGVTLGAGCVVGANCVVTKSFGPHAVIVGVPAKLIKQY